AMLGAGALVALMGAVDDKWGLKAGVRLIGQLAAVSLVMRFGVVMTFLPPTPVGQVGEVALTVLWIVGMTNAINFLDGLDGLASGVSAVAGLFFGLIAAMTGQVALATASFCLAGAALGFFRYNARPASIYLGDSGATLLGFLLACIGLIGDWGTDAPIEDLFVPVIILGVPIYDAIYITVYRFRAGLVRNLGEWAAYVGHDHLHHRLLHLGMRPGRACLFICLGGVALGVLAVILKTKGELDRYDKFLALALVVLFFAGATVLMELGKNGGGGGPPPGPS
ncbi:MAG: MraY family glycosyltransferase, partial [Planctomycetota bacterium]